jgi:hypothetical protein
LKGTSNVVAWSPLNLPNPLLLLLIGLAIGFDLLMNKGGNERDLRSFATKWQVVILSAMLLLILVSLFADTVAPFVYQAY